MHLVIIFARLTSRLEFFFSFRRPMGALQPSAGSHFAGDHTLGDFPERKEPLQSESSFVRHVVRCDEASLRELFTTVLGDEAGYVILDTVRDGGTIVVKMENGLTVEMATPAQALRVMAEHFSWRPSGIEAMTRQISL